MRSLGTKNELMKGGEERERERQSERRGVMVVEDIWFRREEDMPRERERDSEKKKKRKREKENGTITF